MERRAGVWAELVRQEGPPHDISVPYSGTSVRWSIPPDPPHPGRMEPWGSDRGSHGPRLLSARLQGEPAKTRGAGKPGLQTNNRFVRVVFR